MLTHILLYIFWGAFSGFVAGLLGIGGGLLIVPFLAFVLPSVGVPENLLMHVCVATSLTMVIGTSLSSIVAHYHQGGIQWDLVKKIILGLVFGALLGAHLADLLSSGSLRLLFGSFVLYLSFKMAFGVRKSTDKDRQLPSKVKLTFIGTGIAAFCNLLGLGGGSLLVPFFRRYQIPMRSAVATSAVCGFPIALTGVIGLIIVGADEVGLPPGMLGYVYLPAFLAMILPSIVCAPLGAKLAHRLSAKKLQRIFALFLILVAVDMLSNAAREFIMWFLAVCKQYV